MTLEEILTFNFIKQNYEGIIEIYPQKATNSMILNKVIHEIQKDYDLVQVYKGWIRAFKKDKEDIFQFDSPERAFVKLRPKKMDDLSIL